MIRRNTRYKENGFDCTFVQINSYRPHLEYCIHAWRLYHRKEIHMLEKSIEEGNLKIISGPRELRFEERLKECKLTKLEMTERRGGGSNMFF